MSRGVAAARGAICIFGVVNTSVAYRERPRCVFQAPYINPLFNTPLSARPAGKEEEEGVPAGERSSGASSKIMVAQLEKRAQRMAEIRKREVDPEQSRYS